MPLTKERIAAIIQRTADCVQSEARELVEHIKAQDAKLAEQAREIQTLRAALDEARELIARYVGSKIIMKITVAEEIQEELKNARLAFRDMQSAHEGYAVLFEEVDELWDEIRRKNPDVAKMHKEAIQVAAMAI